MKLRIRIKKRDDKARLQKAFNAMAAECVIRSEMERAKALLGGEK